MDLPLILWHLGDILSDRIFDDKMSVHEDFQFNRHKYGYAWKSKIERYMISRILGLAKILYWAERREVEITNELLAPANFVIAEILYHFFISQTSIFFF